MQQRCAMTAKALSLCVVATMVAGCEPGVLASAGTLEQPGGRLLILLTDAPAPAIERIDIAIERVDVVFADGEETPRTILDSPRNFNLLDLRGGVTAVLADALLPVGVIQQIRLILSEQGNTVTVDGEQFPLRVPSGDQAGLKLTRPGGFVIAPNVTTEVIVDFDAEQSVHYSPGQGWILRPVVKLIDAIVLEVSRPAVGAVLASKDVAVEGTVLSIAPIAGVKANGTALTLDGEGFSGTVRVEEGEQTIEVVATDVHGLSAVVRIAVVIDVTPPHVEIISPYAGRVVVGTLGVQAAARDASGIASVTLHVDGAAITTVAREPFLVWIESGYYANGYHVFSASAVDKAGNSATSATVSANFENIASFGISSIEPTRGAVGSYVTLRGSEFMPPVRVYFGDSEAVVYQATYSTLQVVVPEIAGSVTVTIRRGDGLAATSRDSFSRLEKAKLSGGPVETYDESRQPPVIVVKFAEGLQLRARDGTWTSDGIDDVAGLSSLISGLGASRVQLRTPLTETQAGLAHQVAEDYWQSDEDDPLLIQQIVFDGDSDPTALYEALSSLPIVERITFVPIAVPQQIDPLLPWTPDLTRAQFYRALSTTTDFTRDNGRRDPCRNAEAEPGDLDDTAGGLGFDYVNSLPGGRGETVRIVDIEAAWESEHEDLPMISISRHSEAWVRPPALADLPDILIQHGTSVAGILWAEDNTYGVTGVAPLSIPRLVSVVSENPLDPNDVDGAIDLALEATLAGDIILVEDGCLGNVWECHGACPGFDCRCFFLLEAQLPAEASWLFSDAIRRAISSHRVVVESGANGMQLTEGNGVNLDLLSYDPFGLSRVGVDRDHDTGAIVVGGVWPSGWRQDQSNFGSRVDMHAYARQVATTGQCDYFWAFDNEGDDPLPACHVWTKFDNRPDDTCANSSEFRSLDGRQGYTAWFGGTSAASALVAGAAADLQGYAKHLRNGSTLSPELVRNVLVNSGRWVNQVPTEPIGPLIDVEAAARAVREMLNPPFFVSLQGQFPSNLIGVFDISVADFDNNEELEIFLARDGFEGDSPLGDVLLRRGNCLTAFCVDGAGIEFSDDAGGSGAAAAADFNADSYKDIYVSAGGIATQYATDFVYQNKPVFPFKRGFDAITPMLFPARMPLFDTFSFDVAAGEINGDGLPDVVVAVDSLRTHIAINQTIGSDISFYDGSAHLPALPESQNLVAIVFDVVNQSNQGVSDIFIGRSYKQYPVPPQDNPDLLLQNRGATCFLDHAAVCFDLSESNLLSAPHSTTSAVVFDFEGDGIDDIVAGVTHHTAVPVFYRNQGDGTFLDVASLELSARARAAFEGRTTYDLVAADFDQDGDRDILFSTQVGLLLLEHVDRAFHAFRYDLPESERFGPEFSGIIAHKLALYPLSAGGHGVICANRQTGLTLLAGRSR
ncbi:MAG: DUF4382 domain-containing protein [Deltaproteobacteria bacterium]|nr:DUF4382 domain-containing protein [Deltaproteobacteria bacterium]